MAIAAHGAPTIDILNYGTYSESSASDSPRWRLGRKRRPGRAIVRVALGEGYSLDESSGALVRAEASSQFEVVP